MKGNWEWKKLWAVFNLPFPFQTLG